MLGKESWVKKQDKCYLLDKYHLDSSDKNKVVPETELEMTKIDSY